MSSLQRKEFLYEQPAFPEVEYIFKHALTQEVAYGTVLQERRKALHERTAQAIEALSHDRLEEHYSELAHHYSRSGNTEKAIEYLQLAGQQSVQRSANAEAVSHLTTALELLTTFPDTVVRARQELALQTTLGTALSATQGFGAPEREHAFDRARELCQQIGETPQLFPVLWGLCQSHIAQGKFQSAREEAEQLLHLARRAQDPVLLLGAHEVLGETLFWSGELTLALGHFEQGSAFYDPRQHRALVSLYGIDPGVLCQDLGAWTLWLLGYPDQAQKRSHEALSMVRELAHPYSLVITLYFAYPIPAHDTAWSAVVTGRLARAPAPRVARTHALPWPATISSAASCSSLWPVLGTGTRPRRAAHAALSWQSSTSRRRVGRLLLGASSRARRARAPRGRAARGRSRSPPRSTRSFRASR